MVIRFSLYLPNYCETSWGIYQENITSTRDGSVNGVIDKNMTMGELVQGLTILAQNNAEKTDLKIQVLTEQNQEKDP